MTIDGEKTPLEEEFLSLMRTLFPNGIRDIDAQELRERRHIFMSGAFAILSILGPDKDSCVRTVLQEILDFRHPSQNGKE